MVAYYFAPTAAVGAKRPLGFARHLEEYGWAPRVVAAAPGSVYPPHPEDPELLQLLSPAVQVDRVGYPDPRRRLLALRDCLRRPQRPATPAGVADDTISREDTSPTTFPTARSWLEHAIRVIWARLLEFPDPQKFWRRRVVAHVREHAAAYGRPDVVYATGGPWTSLLAGHDIATHLGVPFVADFRDPWTTDELVREESPWLKRLARRLNRDVCEGAAVVIANTDAQRAAFAAEFPDLADRIMTITNGYQEAPRDAAEIPVFDGPVELAHFGSIYDAYGEGNVVVLLETLRDLARAGSLNANMLRFRFVGAWELNDPTTEATVHELEAQGIVQREPVIPFRDAVARMARAHALLLFQPTSEVRIPAKTYEYLAARRPIVVIGVRGAAIDLIRDCHLGVHCSAEPGAIQSFVRDVTSGRIRLAPPTPEQVAPFGYRALTGQLAAALDRARTSSVIPR